MLNLIAQLLNRPRIARILKEVAEPIAQRQREARLPFTYHISYANEAWEGFDR